MSEPAATSHGRSRSSKNTSVRPQATSHKSSAAEPVRRRSPASCKKRAAAESDRALADLFSTYFANFVKTGNPNGPGVPQWDGSAGTDRLMELGTEQGMTEDRNLPLYEIMDRMTGWEP